MDGIWVNQNHNFIVIVQEKWFLFAYDKVLDYYYCKLDYFFDVKVAI